MEVEDLICCSSTPILPQSFLAGPDYKGRPIVPHSVSAWTPFIRLGCGRCQRSEADQSSSKEASNFL